MITEHKVLRPAWSGEGRLQALCTSRKGGISKAPWYSLNLGDHVGDNPLHVGENRQSLARFAGLSSTRIGWLEQVHGTDVIELTQASVATRPRADASFTREPKLACAILTADCLPVLLADRNGTVVGAAHAGWRGLSQSVLENPIRAMEVEPGDLLAWFGPAIGPGHFEMGPEVKAAFVEQDAHAEVAFSAVGAREGHFMADLYRLARQRLQRAGVTAISGGSLCTVNDREWLFSYRRDQQTGRMASVIWLN